jgi:diguanylate cyclase
MDKLSSARADAQALPQTTETDSKAVGHAHAAINSMLRFSIAPTPHNFTVWFDYHSGGQPMVRRVIDVFMSNGRTIDGRVMRELFQRFYQHDSELPAFLAASGRMQETLAAVVEKIADAGGGTTTYAASLSKASDRLMALSIDGPSALSDLAGQTAEMSHRYATLGDELSVSAGQMDALRHELSEARREASTDALTGLPNRRAFDARVEAATNRTPKGSGFSLVMADIDRFKSINDRFGHPVGDAVLRRVAQSMLTSLREKDMAARFGGEEFMVLLDGVPLMSAKEIAERIRIAVREQTYSLRDSGREIVMVTVSLGVAQHRAGEPAAAVAERADAALYRAKGAGRGRVVAEDAVQV